MRFLRVVEVFPPHYRNAIRNESTDLGSKMESFVGGVREIKEYADLVLVASLKDPHLTALSTTSAAHLLAQQAGVEAAPVIVARDANRREVASTILGAYSLGLRTLMLAWGDRDPPGGPRNVYDFSGLSDVIGEARRISAMAGVKSRILAPVDLSRLSRSGGADLAKVRLEAGADLFLAQPPTTDAKSLDGHLAVLGRHGLGDRVLLNIFPFKDKDDVRRSEALFGWKLPASLKRRAASMNYAPIEEARAMARRLRGEGLPGVYLSTRGLPGIARQILG